MAVKFTNNAKTTLASSLTNVATSASVVDGSVFPTLGAGEYFYCTFDDGSNNEIVKVTARSGNTLTIVRGVDNTSARAFSSGDSAELRATAGLLTDIQENIAAKSANQTVYNTTTASSATDYDIGIDPSVEANAMVFLNGVMQHHDTFSFSGSTLSFDTAPPDGMALEVIVDNLINLQSSNLTVDTFTAADVGGNPQTDFTLSDAPAAEDNLLVFIDGVFQDQDAYTISNQTLTITDGVTADFGVTVYVINPVNIGTPSDGTVTSSKLSGNITMPADLTVTGDVAFDSPTFVVDNANSRVGIGTASPSTLLDIVGDVKMSANLTVDTSTLHVDSANNRVGIGTASPAYKIDSRVSTSASIVAGLNLDASGNSNGDGSAINFSRAGNVLSSVAKISAVKAEVSNNETDLVFSNYAAGSLTEKMRIVGATGRVGIGVSPSNKLHVYNTASADVALLESTQVFSTLAFKSSTNASTVTVGIDGAGNASFENKLSSGNMTFVTNGSERMRIDSSGRVGIGTTSPAAKLDVSGVFQFFDDVSPEIKIVDSDDNNYALIGYSDGTMSLSSNHGNEAGGADVMQFLTGGSESMRIDSDARLAINNTTSASDSNINDQVKLVCGGGVVVGSAAATNNSFLQYTDAGGLTILQGSGSYGLRIFDDNSSTPRLTVFRSGNVGINNNSPENKLQVDVSSSSEGTDSISVQNSGVSSVGHTTGLRFRFSSAVPSAIRSRLTNTSNGAGTLSFYTSPDGTAGNLTERMTIDNSGSLMVGVTSPVSNATQTIYKSNLDYGLFIRKGDGTTGSTNKYIGFDISGGGTTGGSITNSSAGNAQFTSTSDERLKENIEGVTGCLDKVMALKPSSYTLKENNLDVPYGFIAQNVETVLPEFVSENEEGYKQISDGLTSGYIAVLTKAIQEQQEQIETLKQEIREIREGG